MQALYNDLLNFADYLTTCSMMWMRSVVEYPLKSIFFSWLVWVLCWIDSVCYNLSFKCWQVTGRRRIVGWRFFVNILVVFVSDLWNCGSASVLYVWVNFKYEIAWIFDHMNCVATFPSWFAAIYSFQSIPNFIHGYTGLLQILQLILLATILFSCPTWSQKFCLQFFSVYYLLIICAAAIFNCWGQTLTSANTQSLLVVFMLLPFFWVSSISSMLNS